MAMLMMEMDAAALALLNHYTLAPMYPTLSVSALTFEEMGLLYHLQMGTVMMAI